MKFSRPLCWLLLLGVLILAVFPFVGAEYYIELVVRIMIFGIFAMSLDLLIGFTGLVSFGHAAFFGLAGYILAIVTPEASGVSLFWSLPLSILVSGLAAAIIGWFSVRTTGIYFIMITLAFAQMVFYYFQEAVQWGGSDGMFLFFRPTVAVGDTVILDLEQNRTFYFLVLGSLVASLLLVKRLLGSPFGQVIMGIKANESRTRAIGFATFYYKWVSFIIAGMLAGLAGYLEVTHAGTISPGYLAWHESGIVIMVVVLGGLGTLYGPVIGAFVFVLLQDFLQDYTSHWLLVMGVLVMLIALFLPNGVTGLLERLLRPKAKENSSEQNPEHLDHRT